MVVKINNKPILVEKEDDKGGVNWLYLGVCATGTLLALYMLDLVAALFLYVHPFPFIKWVGVILSWLF